MSLCLSTVTAGPAPPNARGPDPKDRERDTLYHLDALLDASETRRELPVVAACARLRKGELLGGHAGALLVEQADAELRARGVRNPAVFSGLYAPLGVQA